MGFGGTQRDENHKAAAKVTESVSGSPAAGLWILSLYSRLPALLTEELMKDKTELDTKHKQTHALVHILEREREKDTVAQKRSLYSI